MEANQPSITAENNAAVRTFETMRPAHEQICSDAYACHFLSDRFRNSPNLSGALSQTMNDWEMIVPGVCGSIIARTRFIDDCLAKAIDNDVEQLVILGAGYDTRPFRFEALKDKVRVFEIDHPKTQEYKLKRLKRFSPGAEDFVTYIPVNFEKQDFGEALLAHGYDSALHTFFIWEGVSYYLHANVVDHTLFFIADNSAPGSEIVFDYFPASMAQGACNLPEARPLTQILNNFGERIHFGISPEKMASFLDIHGFKVIQNLTSDDYKEAYFKGRAGQGRTVSKLFFFVHAMVT